MKKKVLLGVVLGLFVFASQATAGVIYSENFDSYATGTSNPGSWAENAAAYGDNSVVETPLSGAGTKSLYVNDTDSGNTYTVRNQAIGYTFTTDEVQIDYWARASQKDEVTFSCDLRDENHAGIAGLAFWNNGRIATYDGGWYGSGSGTVYSADTNYHFRIILDPTNHTWKYYIDNMTTAVATGISWGNNTDSLNKWNVGSYGGTTQKIYLDDVLIQNIPEPATMTLLLLGLPFTLRRRR